MWSDISWCHISKYSLRKALSKVRGKFKKNYFDETGFKNILQLDCEFNLQAQPNLISEKPHRSCPKERLLLANIHLN